MLREQDLIRVSLRVRDTALSKNKTADRTMFWHAGGMILCGSLKLGRLIFAAAADDASDG